MATTKRKRQAPAGGADHIEDIQHEEVKSPATPVVTSEVQEAEVVDDEKVLALTIQKEIKRFNLADDGIAALKKAFGDLQVKNVDDKAGYKLVKDAWNNVRSTRTALEKKGLDIRNGYNKITKAVKKEEDRLIELISPLEDDLYKKWKAIDDEKDRLKKEKEEAEQKALLARLSKLTERGMAVKDGYYSIGETIAVDVATIRGMTDDQFANLEKAVQAKATELAEAKKAKEEEDERERKRLKDEQDKLEQQRLDQKKKQDELDQKELELKQKEEKAAKARFELRLDTLETVGMTISAGGKAVKYDNGVGSHEVTVDAIRAASDEEFLAMVKTARAAVEDAKVKYREKEQQAEQERKELEHKKLRVNDYMVIAGLVFNYATDRFNFANDFVNISKTMDELVKLSDEELKVLSSKLATDIAQAKQKQLEREKEQDKIRERERREKLGDAVNFSEYLESVQAVETPELSSTDYQQKLHEFRSRLNSLINEYKPEPEVINHEQ